MISRNNLLLEKHVEPPSLVEIWAEKEPAFSRNICRSDEIQIDNVLQSSFVRGDFVEGSVPRFHERFVKSL